MAIVKAYVGNFKGPQGETGPAGPQGPQGPQGPAGAIPEIATEVQAGIVKAGDDIGVGDDGGMTVKTNFTKANELANIVANEALKIMLGKLAGWYPKVSNALQTTDLVSVQTDDATKVPSAALAYAMQQQLDSQNSDIEDFKIINNRSNTIGYFEKIDITLSAADSMAYLIIMSNTKNGVGIYAISRYAGHAYVVCPVVSNANYTLSISGNTLHIVSTYASGLSIFNIA